jgi:hypothetical protein
LEIWTSGSCTKEHVHFFARQLHRPNERAGLVSSVLSHPEPPLQKYGNMSACSNTTKGNNTAALFSYQRAVYHIPSGCLRLPCTELFQKWNIHPEPSICTTQETVRTGTNFIFSRQFSIIQLSIHSVRTPLCLLIFSFQVSRS